MEKDSSILNVLSVGLLIYNFKCEPNEITQILDIVPTETFLKGMKVNPKTINTHHYNGWWLASKLDSNDMDVEKHVQALTAIIESKLDNFKSLPSECQIELSCGITWNNLDDRPGLHFSSNTIKTLAQIGGTIDIALF
jgi:hypothetical protein